MSDTPNVKIINALFDLHSSSEAAMLPACLGHNMKAKQRRSKMPHIENNPRRTNPPSVPVVHSPFDTNLNRDKSTECPTHLLVHLSGAFAQQSALLTLGLIMNI